MKPSEAEALHARAADLEAALRECRKMARMAAEPKANPRVYLRRIDLRVTRVVGIE